MLSEQYAAALYELTIDCIDKIKDNFDDFMEIIKKNNDFYLVLKSPTIDKRKKKEIIKNTLKMEDVFINFLYVLIDNNRMEIINDIYKIFNVLVVEAKGIYVIDAYSSEALSPNEITQLSKSMSQKINGVVRINNIIDVNAIGGLRLEHNGESIDQTFKTQIQNLKSLL